MKRKKISFIALSLAIIGFSPLSIFPKVFADEITVSGNGAGASSDVAVQSSQNTTVAQSNETNVSNNVSTDASTGNNQASDNSGDVAITTGDVSTNTSVSTQANSSSADVSPCCQNGENSISVSGNGAGSNSSVTAATTNTTSTTTTQTATITNSIKGTAVTGNNKASDNQGNVVIQTGDIKHNETIVTGPVNTSSVTVGVPSNYYKVNIFGNGADSQSTVNVVENNQVTSTIFATTNIFNDSVWKLLTGGNVANRNSGDVFITTGSIDSSVVIETKGNESVFKEECCKKHETPTPTPPSPTPTGKPCCDNGGGNGGGNGGSSSGGSGSSSGSSTAAGGSILPVTGGSWLLFFIVGNIIMLFFGVLLRLRSGRSPGFTYNFVL